MEKAKTFISLEKTPITLKESDSSEKNGTAEVKLILDPKPETVFECEFPRPNRISLESLSASIYFHEYDTVVEVFRKPSSLTSTKEIYTPYQEPVTIKAHNNQLLSYVVFDILNFSNLKQRHDIQFDGWCLEITSACELPTLAQKLRNSEGFGRTHSGRLHRSDRTLFGASEAEGILDSLRLQCCFARGIYCSPILPTGYDENGTEVWKEWGAAQVDRWCQAPGWADINPPIDLSDTFPNFHKALCSGTKTKNEIHVALSWYLRSNRNNGDTAGGIILSQSALERLANLQGFKVRNRAAANIRLLLNSFKIPTDIPPHLGQLIELSTMRPNRHDPTLSDGPYVLTEIRNHLVHPDHKWEELEENAEFEAWSLGQWYIEMVILAMTGFNGQYGNRLIAGRAKYDLETVPWAKQKS